MFFKKVKKMKKISILLGLMLLTICNVIAQENSKLNYGFYLGSGINWMKIDKSLHYDDSEVEMTNEITHVVDPEHHIDTIIVHPLSATYLEVYDAKVKPYGSFMIGGFVEFQTSEMFGIQMDLMYNQYGYKLTGYIEKDNLSSPGTTIYNYKATTKLSNLSLAILAKIHVLNQHLSIDFGVQPSFCLRDVKEANRSISQKRIQYVSGTEYKPFNLSIVGGVTGCIGDHLLIGARYNYGLMDVLLAKSVSLVGSEADGSQVLSYSYSKAESKTSSVQITIGYKF